MCLAGLNGKGFCLRIGSLKMGGAIVYFPSRAMGKQGGAALGLFGFQAAFRGLINR